MKHCRKHSADWWVVRAGCSCATWNHGISSFGRDPQWFWGPAPLFCPQAGLQGHAAAGIWDTHPHDGVWVAEEHDAIELCHEGKLTRVCFLAKWLDIRRECSWSVLGDKKIGKDYPGESWSSGWLKTREEQRWTWDHTVDVQCLKQWIFKFIKTTANLLHVFWTSQTSWNVAPAKSLSFQLDCLNFWALNAAPCGTESSVQSAGLWEFTPCSRLLGWAPAGGSTGRSTGIQPGMTPMDLFILRVQPEMTQQRFSGVAFHGRDGYRDNPSSLYKIDSWSLNWLLPWAKQAAWKKMS